MQTKIRLLVVFIILTTFGSLTNYCIAQQKKELGTQEIANAIKSFYIAYATNVEQGKSNDSLMRLYMTAELISDIERIRSTNLYDPIIRAQDFDRNAIKTIQVNHTVDDWYMVSYSGYKNKNTIIPIRATSKNKKIIYYITERKDYFGGNNLPNQTQTTCKYLWKFPTEYAGNINENNRIIFQKINNKLEGLYYGTTDEFIDVREGYYPGFFILPMDSLQIIGNEVFFILKPQTKDFFTEPLPESILSTNDALEKGYSHWDNYDNFPFARSRRYHGFFLDSATIFFEKDDAFNSVSKKFLKEK